MSADRLSLRWTLGVLTSVIAAIALFVSTALVALAAVLQDTTGEAVSAVESVRLAQEAEIDLLLHERTKDSVARREFEERIATRLDEAEEFIRGLSAEDAARAADTEIRAYLIATRDPKTPAAAQSEALERAYRALDQFVEISVEASREAQAVAARWNQLGTYAGYGAGCFLLVSAAIGLVWLTRRAFTPVFELAATMEQFGRGAREVRAPEVGPTELRGMSRTFNQLASALAQQRRDQIAFLAGVAHDLRNPISVLKLSAALVPADRPLPPEPQLRRLIEKIARQISRLERMTSDFLDIASIEAGELQLERGWHDARELGAHVADVFDDTLAVSRLQVILPESPVELYCDSLRIEQVLTNLVSNAIKYSPAESEILLSLEREGDEVVFRVVDHGIGIAASERARIFEAFQRVGLSKENAPGAGLGLFVVRRIIEAHGGTIDVESTPGAGSTFCVRLPGRFNGVGERDPAHDAHRATAHARS